MTPQLLTAGLVLPGPAGTAIFGGGVLIEGGLIRAVGPADQISAGLPATVPRRDFPGGTILPGLIDCHVHLAFDASADPATALAAADERTLLLDMAARAHTLLDSGVTTVRDLGDRAGLACAVRDAVAAGRITGPRILAARAPITSRGGHCWFLGGVATGPEEIRTLVRRTIEAGADVIKVMMTGGQLTAAGPDLWQSQFGADELAAAVGEAHLRGTRVAVHAHGVAGIETAVAAGVDTLEHGTFLTTAGPAAGPAATEEVLEAIAAAGIAICPTFNAGLDTVLRNVGPRVVQPWLDLLRRQHALGIPIIAGTDAGVPRAPFDGYVAGLQWLARAGLSNDAVLASATVAAAGALGLDGRTGRLAAGLDADLVVVDGDPRTDLSALRRLRLVVARGRAHLPCPFAASPRMEPDPTGFDPVPREDASPAQLAMGDR